MAISLHVQQPFEAEEKKRLGTFLTLETPAFGRKEEPKEVEKKEKKSKEEARWPQIGYQLRGEDQESGLDTGVRGG